MTKYDKDLKNRLPTALGVHQIDSKQMATVTQADGSVILYSYFTRVGRKRGNTWYLLTKSKYSPTTSKQLTQFAFSCSNVEWVDDIDNIRN